MTAAGEKGVALREGRMKTHMRALEVACRRAAYDRDVSKEYQVREAKAVVQARFNDLRQRLGKTLADRDRLARELAAALADRDAAAARARSEAIEDAARIADEWAAENMRMAMDSIHLDPALAHADFSPDAQKMTDKMQAHGAHHAGAFAGCEQVAKAIRALDAGSKP